MLTKCLSVSILGVSFPALLLSSTMMRFNYYLRGLKLLETSKDALLKEVGLFVKTNKLFSSLWFIDNTVHVLCRYATIFSGRNPIVIVANSCSFDYIEFIKKIPLYYDVYCIDLPKCQFYATHLNTVLSLLGREKYTLFCESYGAGLIIESLIFNRLSISKISDLVLIDFEPRSIYLWTRVKILILQMTVRNRWSSLLFSAFLYSRPSVLSRIKAIYNFIPEKSNFNSFNYESVNYTTDAHSWYNLERDILHLSKKVKITLLESSQIGYSNAVTLSSKSANDFKVLNLDLLDDTTNKKTIFEFIEKMYA